MVEIKETPVGFAVTNSNGFGSFPTHCLASLVKRGKYVHLPVGALLASAEAPARFVHVIMSGIVSMTVPMRVGNSPEICMLGPGEIVETREMITGTVSRRNPVVRTPGVALRLRFQVAQEVMAENPDLREYMRVALENQNRQVDQIAACNTVHQVEARLARYLLMLQDRSDADGVQVTQDVLGQALGVRRTSVTASAGSLQRKGFIRFRRGTIFIHDRPGLAAAACECYGAITCGRQQPLHPAPPAYNNPLDFVRCVYDHHPANGV